MRALVTGGTGFIGTHLAEALLKKGHKVRLVVRESSNTEFYRGKPVELFYSEIDDEKKLGDICKGIDAVFHLAGILGGPDVMDEDLENVNVGGTENMLKAALSAKVKRFVYMSGGAAMGDVADGSDEKTKCNPTSPYGWSKYNAEQKVKEYGKKGLNYTIIRSAMCYGPREMSSKLPLIRMIKKGMFTIIGNGENKTNWVYVENLADAVILAAESKKSIGETYIIADEEPVSMNEVANTIAGGLDVKKPRHLPTIIAYAAAVFFEVGSKIFRFKPPLFRERVKSLTLHRIFDTSKSERELGKPKTSFAEGMKKTIKWYQEQGLL